jgi:hypothetical protein
MEGLALLPNPLIVSVATLMITCVTTQHVARCIASRQQVSVVLLLNQIALQQ